MSASPDTDAEMEAQLEAELAAEAVVEAEAEAEAEAGTPGPPMHHHQQRFYHPPAPVTPMSAPVFGARPLPTPEKRGNPRPKGVHTKHLTELERFRVRTLYYDGCISKQKIQKITGYSESQIRTAVRAKSAQIGKRPGRPKKGSKPPKVLEAENGAALTLDAEARLVKAARRFFEAEEAPEISPNGAELSTPTRAPFPGAASFQTPAATPVSAPLPPPSPPPPPLFPKFSHLPPEIRRQIWRSALSFGPYQDPPSRQWALSVKPVPPYLSLGIVPPGVQLTNTPWPLYVSDRHVPAMILSQVNREARNVVSERLTPIVVADAIRQQPGQTPPFVWIDRHSDTVHFDDAQVDAVTWYEKAGQAAWPALYRSRLVTSDPSSPRTGHSRGGESL
ncbi:hypothetical protein F5Y15DRAFT_404120 [Xylariaceae sp. FL0016]|nr:hypothetical protein F5Y15DRAFT_404120 [Xylariaceae sp. FL0016]